jgi:hypothetical protein
MKTRRLGRSGHLSSLAILGGAAFWDADVETARRALELALAAGVNHVNDWTFLAPRRRRASADRAIISTRT